MSRDAHSQWHNDSDQELRYYSEPKPGCNLSVGFETFVKKDEEKEKEEHIIPILSWLHNRRTQDISADNPDFEVITRPHFVAWRGMFARILCTPYNRSEAWRFLACRYKGTIYIAEKPTEADMARRRNQSQREELMCYWGYKFEDYATRPREAKKAPGDEPVSNIPCFCTVVRARLGSHLILMSGETDCCMEGTRQRSDSYVELKTNKMITTERDKTSFERYKLIKFWSQSYLAGIPHIVVGFRDDEGIVRTIQRFKTFDIPKFVERKRGLWDPTTCMNFCNDFLTWVAGLFEEDAVREDDAQKVWVLDFTAPFNQIEATLSEDGSNAFLPAWFTSSSDAPPRARSPPKADPTQGPTQDAGASRRKRPEEEGEQPSEKDSADCVPGAIPKRPRHDD